MSNNNLLVSRANHSTFGYTFSKIKHLLMKHIDYSSLTMKHNSTSVRVTSLTVLKSNQSTETPTINNNHYTNKASLIDQ